jgi:mRNA interferase YafQ
VKRKLDISKMNVVVEILLAGKQLPEKYQDHSITENWSGYRECHIQPDWLLVYYIKDDLLVLTLTRTGTHSDLFYKEFVLIIEQIRLNIFNNVGKLNPNN